MIKRFLKRLLRRSRRKRHSGPGGKRGKSKPVVEADSMGEGSMISGSLQREKSGGQIHIGDHCLIEGLVKTESAEGKILIGDNVYLGGGSSLSAAKSITIGDDVLISYRVLVMDSDSHNIRYSIRKKDLADWRKNSGHDWSTTKCGDVVIGKGAWIGAGCIILKGVSIGEGSVIGAGSVVTRSVAPWTIAAGNPARVIRELGEDER